jgi:hypothetical protein
MTITIKTSCGQLFEMSPSEMTDRQLRGLLEQNPDAELKRLPDSEIPEWDVPDEWKPPEPEIPF